MTVPPLRRQILVGCDQATAYRSFVNEIGAWWPLGSHSCFGDGGTVALDGDRFVEIGPTGETAVWGTITAAEAPRLVSFTWHPGREADPTGHPGHGQLHGDLRRRHNARDAPACRLGELP